jgi:hypothetical protein
MKRIKRSLRRAWKGVTRRARRLIGSGPREMSDDEIRARLIAAVESVRGVEIDDVYPAGTARVEVHR